MDRLADAGRASAGWEIRRRNVIQPGQVWGPGQIMDDGCAGALALPRCRRARLRGGRSAAGHAVGVGPRPEELRAGQRVPRDRPGGGALPRRRHASRCATAGPRWARASTPSPRQVAVDRARRRPRAHRRARRHHARARRRPDHREPGHAHGRRLGGRRLPGGAGRRLPARGRLRGRVPRRLDQQDRRRARAPDHPLGVRLRRPAGDRSTATSGDHRARWWPSTTWAGPSTRCCARARSTGPCTWASATP